MTTGDGAATTQPTGRERLREAFWTLLDGRNYESFTVRDVCRVAGVNKNTFYYHYGSLDELAADAIGHLVPFELFGTILNRMLAGERERAAEGDGATGGSDAAGAANGSGVESGIGDAFPPIRPGDIDMFPQRYARLLLTVGRHSSPALQAILKSTLLDGWSSMLGIDVAQLGEESRLAIDFLFGGIMGLWGHYALADEQARHARGASSAAGIPAANGTGAPATDGGEVPVQPAAIFESSFFQRLTRALPPVLLATFRDDGAIIDPTIPSP
ncbi:TetR/AcrR family transcriptional regulator [Bifidobacterium choloepi]|uniref:TetR/AcrR family transcriptional regulator n=1 Tax=Bifidobacterium choloepi TaxID=2614131 RepID=A0A6I5N1T2_9BIFI|nr:TetR/AcrR family transcriptional regulator [Bifidobacterium choloepi]NEG70436.1 TetR/AcrR family transcriptional regulator [Bifidobacterium choloepi]